MSDHGIEQFKPNTTIAAVIHCQGKYLLVEEREHGKTVFNQPAGHLEASENLISAIQREVKEETGLVLTPQYCSGIYYFHRPEINLYFLRFCFVIELEQCPQASPEDDEIIACHWLTYDEIVSRKNQLRSPMVLSCIDDFVKGNNIALDMLKTNL